MGSSATLFALAVGSGLLATFAARAFARRVGLMDRPDGHCKIQPEAVPVAGGLALLASVPLTILAACILSDDAHRAITADLRSALALLIAAALIGCVGLADDIWNLRARYKLLGQALAIAVPIFGGDFRIDSISLLGASVPLGYGSIPLTFLWYLTVVNALNLLDGMDGMLGTVAAILCGGLGAMAFAVGHPLEGFVALALAGALIGFLRFNLPPATVYLGDCGSMVVGLTIAALATRAALDGPTFAIAAPVALLALPFADIAAAIARRKLTGRALAIGDREHLHHVLRKRGLSCRRALVLVSALCGLASVGAAASTVLHSDLAALAVAVGIGAILVSCGLFGNAELRLLVRAVRAGFGRLRRIPARIDLKVGTAPPVPILKSL